MFLEFALNCPSWILTHLVSAWVWTYYELGTLQVLWRRIHVGF